MTRAFTVVLALASTFVLVRPTGAAQVAAAVAAGETTAPATTAPQAPAERELGATTNLGDGEWRRPTDPIEIELSRHLDAGDGRIAVLIGDTDWTGVFTRTDRRLSFRPGALRLPSGETTLGLYHVTDAGTWQPVATWPLRVLTPAGLVRADVAPKIDLANKGQLAEGHRPETNAPPRDTFQDLVANLGVQTVHTTRGGLTATTQVNILGASFQQEALRFAVEGERAPLVDLADYRLGLEGPRGKAALGHLAVSPHRYLANTFQSRGLTGQLRFGAVDVAGAALNGTNIVGWDNPFGLADRSHQVLLATVGAELVPSRPGGTRVEVTVLDGSLRPLSGFTDNRITDTETSRGVGLRVMATDRGGRLRLDGGSSASRFTNPADPLLGQSVSLVPVRERSGTARYLDASYDVLRRTLGSRSPFVLTGTYRHERVDPLYRSVAATQGVQPDLMLHTLETSGTVGAATATVAYTRSHDNLADLASILTTRTRVVTTNVAVPLPSFQTDPSRGRWWPLLIYTLDRTHQFGDGMPVNGGFDSPSQIPDQMSINHVFKAEWSAGVWRAGYGANRSFQDNRQIGRVTADLGNTIHQLSLGVMPGSSFDAGVDLAFERAENVELARETQTRRTGVNGNWRVRPSSTLMGTVNRTTIREAAVADNAITETMLQFTQGFRLPSSGAARPRAQVFVRYTHQSGDLFDLLFGIAESRRNWSLNTGLTLSLFEGVLR